MTFNASFCRKLNQSGAFSSSPDGKELNLASLVPKLRKLGNDGFTEHVQMKKEQLCQCLEDAKGTGQLVFVEQIIFLLSKFNFNSSQKLIGFNTHIQVDGFDI